MRLLVLGGTHFLGRHVASAALARGHDVATFTRGVSGAPPDGARALHGDRDDPAALPAALDGWAPELVVDTSCQTRAAARNAAVALGGVRGYAFVSSLNAYADWPPGPIGAEEGQPTWTTDDDEYGPIKAFAEREIGAAVGDGFLTARAGLIAGPHDPIHRLSPPPRSGGPGR
jgi:nucleoside-diphosphate-sugar epimerase